MTFTQYRSIVRIAKAKKVYSNPQARISEVRLQGRLRIHRPFQPHVPQSDRPVADGFSAQDRADVGRGNRASEWNPREWLGPESNRGHEDFQSSALPTELPSLTLLLRNLCGRVPIFQPRGAVKRFAIEGGDLPHDYFGRERSAAGITFRMASHSRDCVCHASHIGPL